jgi:hypothetical protein
VVNDLNDDRWNDWRGAFWRVLESRVFPVASTDRLFNMYRDSNPAVDATGAAEIRRVNLAAYLDCFEDRPQWLIVAEAPGPWGCRFTGVPITSESQLEDVRFPVRGRRTSTGDEKPHREYSARVFWRALADVFPNFLVWNTVPFHPHMGNEPLTIRTPTAAEIREGSEILAELYKLLQPSRTFAVGRKAESALGSIGAECQYVRHPSQGGAIIFTQTMRAIAASSPKLITGSPWSER